MPKKSYQSVFNTDFFIYQSSKTKLNVSFYFELAIIIFRFSGNFLLAPESLRFKPTKKYRANDISSNFQNQANQEGGEVL